MEKYSTFRQDLANLPGLSHGNFHYKKGVGFIQYKETENDLVSKIMKAKTMMLNQFPELANHIGELPDEIMNESDKEVRMSHLRNYYDSLNSIFSNHKLDYYLNQNSRIFRSANHSI